MILLSLSAVSDPERRGWGRETLPEVAVPGTPSTRAPGAARSALVVLNGSQVGERVVLEGVMMAGRAPEAGLVLRDPAVAWEHARFVPEADGWWVEALDASRPVEVDGIRASRFLLAPDDRIQLGATVLRYELHGPAEELFYAVVEERLNRAELTGLVSRRHFDVELAARVESAARHDSVLAVLVFDIDGLKTINDRHGHLVGARVISSTGRALGSQLAQGALACRLGGDEFAIALEVRDRAEAVTIAERLRDAVGDMSLEHDNETLEVTISGGIATMPEDGADPLALLRAADDALLRAKRAGRAIVSS